MAMTAREALVDLLAMLDRDRGAFRTLPDQRSIAAARASLVAVEVRPLFTYMRCDTAECPSRLELPGEVDARAAAEVARALGWRAGHATHRCPSCDGKDC